MKNRGVLVLVVVAAVAGGACWFIKSRETDRTRATSTVTQGPGSAAPAWPTNTPSMVATKDPARATVTVTSEKGPIAGATVRLAPGDGEVITLQTDAQGIGRADKLEPGSYAISGSAPGFEPAALDAQELAAGQEATLALVLVAGGRPLTGTVTDASGGPVAGARIDAARRNASGRTESAVASTLTGTDGTYQLSVAEGHHVVVAASPDYAPQAKNVDVGASGAIADFALVPGGVIEGVVRDARSREPVAGAIVRARLDGGSGIRFGGETVRRATASADGRFRLTGMRPGSYEIEAEDETRTTREPTVIGLGVGEQVTDLALLVGTGATVSGTVIDDAGAPVPNIEVISFGPGRSDGRNKTDAKGAFVLSGMPPGSHTLMARSDIYAPVLGRAVELGDKDLTGVVVRVRRGLEIIGHVEPRQPCEIEHDPEGLGTGPINFPLEAKTTGLDGAFKLSPAEAGQARLSAVCTSGDRGEVVVDVKAGMPEVVLVVKPGASIAGKVVDGTGKPVSGMTVMASPEEGTIRTTIVNGMVTSGVQGVTSPDGTYRLVGVPAGAHRMTVLDRGRPARMRGKPVVVRLGPTDKKTGVDVAIDLPNGVIEGVVTGPDGQPLADAWVSVHQDVEELFRRMVEDGEAAEEKAKQDGEKKSSSRMTSITTSDDGEGSVGAEFPPVLTDAQGRFAVRTLPHAKYEVIAEAQQGALRGRRLGVEPDAKLAIQALGITSLSGTVTGAKGPVALFTLEVDGPTKTTRSFTGGTFKLGRVDPGTYTLRVRSSDGNAEAKVTVVAGQPAKSDITLMANAVVIGTLVDVQGKPLANTGVIVVPASPDGRTRISLEGMPPMSNADGTFRVETKAGPSVLVVLTQPSPVIKKDLALEAGKTADIGTFTVDPSKPPP
ncbi:MAG: carboxypeptidase-like regulatory domain-containing protein [Kofleriaceae bacterium]|nr:carboxypeptidase-like regulatory domain-containing protein [Kofleriaceae bacterium]